MRSWLSNELSLALARTFVARSVVSLGSFTLVVVLGRIYGAEGVGVFALAYSLLMAAVVLGRCGMDNALVRFIGRDVHSRHVPSYLRYAILKSFVLSMIGGIVIASSRQSWANIFESPHLSSVMVGLATAAPALVLITIFSGFMKSVRRSGTASLLQNGLIALGAAGLVYVTHKCVAPDAGIEAVGVAYAMSAWLIVGMGVLLSRHWFKHHYQPQGAPEGPYEVQAFRKSSAAFLTYDLSLNLLTSVGMWVAGYFLTDAHVGLVSSTVQLAQLIGIVDIILNTILAPRFAELYYQQEYADLHKLAKRGVLIGLLLTAPAVILCFCFPGFVLSLFGDGFEAAAMPLRIMVAAHLVNIICGSVENLLTMTGHERLQRNISWFAYGTGLLAMLVLTPQFGVTGAVVGFATAMVARKVVGVYFAWRCLGIWTLPIPNLLIYAGIPQISK